MEGFILLAAARGRTKDGRNLYIRGQAKHEFRVIPYNKLISNLNI